MSYTVDLYEKRAISTCQPRPRSGSTPAAISGHLQTDNNTKDAAPTYKSLSLPLVDQNTYQLSSSSIE